MGRWDKKEEKPEAEKPDIKPEVDKPEAKGFKCCRCGGITKISKNGNEVCAECFAPTHWKA